MARIRGSYGRPTFLDVWIPTRIALGSKPRWKYNLQAEKADVYTIPPLQDILCARIQNQPPKCFLVALLNMCKTSGDAIALVEHFPAALHVHTQKGDLPIHIVTKEAHFDVIESMICQGITENLGGNRGCGGLMTKNKQGVSPIAMLNAFAHRHGEEERRGYQLVSLIQKIAFHYLREDLTNDDIKAEMIDPSQIPCLHAALTIGCPPNIISFVNHYSVDDYLEVDLLGRTPIQIAASSTDIDAEVFLSELWRNPTAAFQRNSEGDCLLHQTLKTGVRNMGKYLDDVYFIGSVVQEAPKSLVIKDEVHGMYPFALASSKGWSLGVVYGLLRTNPSVLESFI